MKRVNLLNIEFDNLRLVDLLRELKFGVVFTPNVDHLMKLQHDDEFFKVYQLANYKLCDSKILIYASRFLGTPIKEKISGSDFFPAFYNYHRNNERVKIFLLGGSQGIAKRAQERINKKIGRNIVVAAHSPSFEFEDDEEECRQIIKMIDESEATVLAIGVGAPKQEKWIYKYKDKLPKVNFFFAIGATIDFEAGNVKRAPKWMSDVGFEWLYSLHLYTSDAADDLRCSTLCSLWIF